jgi:ATP-binding cassette subfamily F protein 3
VANKIWYIEDKQIKEYPGTYDEYEYWRKKNEAEAKGIIVPVKKPEPKAKPVQTNVPNPNEKKIKSLQQEVQKVEREIAVLETEKNKIEAELAKSEVYGDFEKLKKAQDVFEKVDFAVTLATKKWEELLNSIDRLEK